MESFGCCEFDLRSMFGSNFLFFLSFLTSLFSPLSPPLFSLFLSFSPSYPLPLCYTIVTGTHTLQNLVLSFAFPALPSSAVPACPTCPQEPRSLGFCLGEVCLGTRGPSPFRQPHLLCPAHCLPGAFPSLSQSLFHLHLSVTLCYCHFFLNFFNY